MDNRNQNRATWVVSSIFLATLVLWIQITFQNPFGIAPASLPGGLIQWQRPKAKSGPVTVSARVWPRPPLKIGPSARVFPFSAFCDQGVMTAYRPQAKVPADAEECNFVLVHSFCDAVGFGDPTYQDQSQEAYGWQCLLCSATPSNGPAAPFARGQHSNGLILWQGLKVNGSGPAKPHPGSVFRGSDTVDLTCWRNSGVTNEPGWPKGGQTQFFCEVAGPEYEEAKKRAGDRHPSFGHFTWATMIRKNDTLEEIEGRLFAPEVSGPEPSLSAFVAVEKLRKKERAGHPQPSISVCLHQVPFNVERTSDRRLRLLVEWTAYNLWILGTERVYIYVNPDAVNATRSYQEALLLRNIDYMVAHWNVTLVHITYPVGAEPLHPGLQASVFYDCYYRSSMEHDYVGMFDYDEFPTAGKFEHSSWTEAFAEEFKRDDISTFIMSGWHVFGMCPRPAPFINPQVATALEPFMDAKPNGWRNKMLVKAGCQRFFGTHDARGPQEGMRPSAVDSKIMYVRHHVENAYSEFENCTEEGLAGVNARTDLTMVRYQALLAQKISEVLKATNSTGLKPSF